MHVTLELRIENTTTLKLTSTPKGGLKADCCNDAFAVAIAIMIICVVCARLLGSK